MGIAAAVLLGGVLYAVTPHAQLGGRPPSPLLSAYAAWMALLAQTPLTPPETSYLALLTGVYPIVGFLLIGEGIESAHRVRVLARKPPAGAALCPPPADVVVAAWDTLVVHVVAARCEELAAAGEVVAPGVRR